MLLREKVIISLFSVLIVLPILIDNAVYGQSPMPIIAGSPYYCGFEDAVENSYWQAIPAGNSENQWKVGTAEKNIGEHGLYVSFDGGATAGCNGTPNYISVYRTFELVDNEVYEISFNWKNPGYGKSELYALIIPDNVSETWSGSGSALPTWIKTYNHMVTDSVLTGAPIWQNATFSYRATEGKFVKLMFLFVHSSESKHPAGYYSPAACIDDVQIGTKYDCIKPEGFTYKALSSSAGQFSWYNGSGPFEIMYKATYDTKWDTIYRERGSGRQVTIRPLQKGSYGAAIRSICGSDTSIWAFFPNIFVSYSSEDCLDFLDLHGPNVICHTGKFDNPSQKIGVVDHGFASKSSRHTVHYVADEYDARTNYKLKTLPPDGMPSVRLGNWDINAEAEMITYKYTVTEESPLLLIKYAIVLQDPGHEKANQPNFNVQILDGKGQTIDDMCGDANFISDKNAEGWEIGQGSGEDVVIYKNWTSTGLNLQGLEGQEITIRFTTRDCSQDGHFGYAYFTLDCMGAKISGIGCGDDMFGKIDAPEGFRYKWYPKGDEDYMNQPGYKDTLKTFTPPKGAQDTGTYMCRVISLDNDSCFFELEANLDPRDVYMDVTPNLVIEDCKAKVTFDNKSYTMTRNHKIKGECETFEWDFGNGQTSFEKSPSDIEYAPDSTYHVRLIAGIADKECIGIYDTIIVIPPFGVTNDTTYAQTCTQKPEYVFDGVTYTSSTVRTFNHTSIYGCDSIVTLNLTVADEFKDSVVMRITNEDDYYFFGQKVEQTRIYTHYVDGENNDCDSIFILNLTVDTLLRINDLVLPDYCTDNLFLEIPYTIKIGEIEEYSLFFGEKAKESGFVDIIREPHSDGIIVVSMPVGIRPDYYDIQLIFYGGKFDNDTVGFIIPIYYPAEILEQKWNDVIAVTNSSINGGYEFSEYSWYLGDNELTGFNKSYIYAPPALQFGSEYRAKLTRVDDGVSIFTCPFEPQRKSADSEISVYPTITARGSVIKVSMTEQGEGSIWDVMGNHISDVILDNETQFNAPDVKGIYLLKINTPNNQSTIFRIIVN